jgi:peptidoglycan/xylan/chitin deacetylase (PgdA/CDA1 family)
MRKYRKILGLFCCLTLAGHTSSHTADDSFPVTVETKPGMTMVIQEASRPDILFKDPSIVDEPAPTATPSISTVPAVTAPGGEKTLYLTFDDGPVDGTQNVLDVLAEEGVEATMFCVGHHAKKRRNVFVRELRMPNLLVANHTYSHANGHYSRFYSNLWEVMSDVEHAQLVLGGRKYLRLAGRNVWRLPEVSRNDGALSRYRRSVEIPKYEQLAKEGFYIYGWDVEWRFDHNSGRPLSTARRLADRISGIYRHKRSARRNKVVLLAHDFMFRDRSSTEELRTFIRIMKSRGWSFKKIDHYSDSRPEPLYVAKYYGKPEHRIVAGTDSRERVPKHTAARKKSDAYLPKPGRVTQPGQPAPTASTRSLQAKLNDAVRGYDLKRVEELIRLGARINQRDEYGRLALNTAVHANSIHLVKILLTMGADLRLKDGKGKTALLAARSYGRQAIEKYLIEYSLKHGVERVVAVNEKPSRIDPLKMLRSRNR